MAEIMKWTRKQGGSEKICWRINWSGTGLQVKFCMTLRDTKLYQAQMKLI